MAQEKTSQYANFKTLLDDEDLFDVSHWDGISQYTESRKLKWSVLEAQLISNIATLYTGGGTVLTATVVGITDTLTFGSLNFFKLNNTTKEASITGNLEVTGQSYSKLAPTLTPLGTTVTIDMNKGNGVILDLGSATADVAVSIINPKAGSSYFIEVVQGLIPKKLIFSSIVDFVGQTTPFTLDITPIDDAVDTVVLWHNGARLRANFQQNHGGLI